MTNMDGKWQRWIIGLTLLLCFVSVDYTLAASEPEFRLDIESLYLQQGVSTTLMLSMTDAQGAEVISIDGLDKFDVFSRSQSTSVRIINGRTNYQATINYTIIPKTTGQITLKARIRYNSKIYETNELQVTVSQIPIYSGSAQGDLFVRTVLSQDEVYLGEKVALIYELYTRYNIESYGFTDYPSIDGVVIKDLPDDQQKVEYVYIDGTRYVKYEVKRAIIDPIRTGTITIPAFNLQVNVLSDRYGGIGSRSRPMYVQTESKELLVKPLPTEGRPKDFSGIVGELQLTGSYNRTEIAYGDALSLLVTASGNCNLDGLKKIITNQIPGFTVYETQKSAAESIRDHTYYAQKEFEVIMVPQISGSIEIAPISIAYFNPVTAAYERVEIPGTRIEVTGNMLVTAQSGLGSQTTAVETVSITQVSYASTNGNYLMLQINKQVLLWVIVGVISLILISLILFPLISRRRQQDSTLRSLYRQLMTAKDVNEVYSLFNKLIKYCFNISVKASSQTLVQNSLPPDLAVQVVEIMNYMESNDNKECADLKTKIKQTYSLIRKYRRALEAE